MKLCEEGLIDKSIWEEKGYSFPTYDRTKMIEATKENPVWIHFGAGNIFRAFHGAVADKLLSDGSLQSGIVVAEGYDYEIIEKAYRPNDNYSILVILKADGNIEKKIVASVGKSLILDSSNQEEFDQLKAVFEKASLQLATFTITEKGYSLVNGKGEILPDVARDFVNGPDKPESYLGKVTALLYARFLSNQKKIAMVSTDNCSHNGDKLYSAVARFAKEWVENAMVEASFLEYIKDKTKVSFPWSMIDKITPRPDESVRKLLEEDGLEETNPIVTSKSTYVAPFVNAEEAEYLVIEDDFPNGRPALEKAGVIFTDRETVNKVERMKVCTCLNPLHTALAVYGCLLGYTLIADEMKDNELKKLVMAIGYKEGLPVVTDPLVISPKDFIDTVVNVRIPNPFMPDTPQRIATDTSQKLAIRFGETIKNYQKTGKDISELKLIPLVFAGWLRYLMAVDDEGKAFELSPDPMLSYLQPYFTDMTLGKVDGCEEKLRQILSDEKIFGLDLYEIGMADTVIGYFKELSKEKGAVRKTLQKYVD